MQPLTQDQLLQTFDLIDRPTAVLLEPELPRPWEDLDYLAWRDPSNPQKVYLCVPLPDRVVGLVFRATPSLPGAAGGICDLCLCSDRRHGAVLATTESWTKPRTRIGTYICADFDCSGAVRGLKPVDRMGETTPNGHRIERLQRNLQAFVGRIIKDR